jgi:hypothetical protein
MPKPLRVAGEVDSWCTRCRLILNHRIVSMKSSRPYQVECLTCRAQHLWRPNPPGERSERPGERSARAGDQTGNGDRSRSSATRSTRPHAALRHEQRWEQAIAGHAVLEFKPYEVAATFQEGELLRHKKFGDGVVTRVIDAHKVEVLFRDEARTLAQGMR